MGHGPPDVDRFRQERRRILRRAALLTYGLLAAAIGVAVVGAAVVAWILSFAGLPFRETWLVLIVIILAVPLIGRIVEAVRKTRGRRESAEEPGREGGRDADDPEDGGRDDSGRERGSRGDRAD